MLILRLAALAAASTAYAAQVPGEIVIPKGGEKFDKSVQDNEDTLRTGADWGVATPGRLRPGIGGGSGRLGDLVVGPGETVRLRTGPIAAEGAITWGAMPDADRIFFGGDGMTSTLGTEVQFFEGFFGNFGKWVELEAPYLSLTLGYLVHKLEVPYAMDPNVNQNDYYLENGNKLRIVHRTPGSTGNSYFIEYLPGVPLSPKANFVGFMPLIGGLDYETFAAGNLLDNFDFQANPGATPPDIHVADGVFEFASINVQSGGVLQFVGPNPARLFSRGQALVEGLIDVSGQTPLEHASDSPLGQAPTLARGGPNAGNGGAGADRPDNSGVGPNALGSFNPSTIPPLSQGILNPEAQIDGKPGAGVGASATLASGPGGVHWPTNFPTDTVTLGGLETNAQCSSDQVGGPGGGGAYALDGSAGQAMAATQFSTQGGSNTPPAGSGGDASVLGIEAPSAPLLVRLLTPRLGFLRGGSGGGGGGAHVQQTTTDGNGSPDPCVGSGASIPQTAAQPYRSHSGAAGGGGGGAMQLQAGRLARIHGVLDASGGDGGNALAVGMVNQLLASPGGGASGGALLVQARTLDLAGQPMRMSVAGGQGGAGVSGSVGGDGSPGLVRIEARRKARTLQLAPSIDPFDSSDPLSAQFLSVGSWRPQRGFPEAFSGAQSCWIRPEGTFTSLQFIDDASSLLGWDMDLELELGSGPMLESYRGANSVMAVSYQQLWGELLDRDLMPGEVGAPMIVRFQGARLTGSLPAPPNNCSNVPLSGPNSPIVQGSLTPWVRHPAELNAFSPQPDMIRFVIIFDNSKPDSPKLRGVTNLEIRAVPQ